MTQGAPIYPQRSFEERLVELLDQIYFAANYANTATVIKNQSGRSSRQCKGDYRAR